MHELSIVVNLFDILKEKAEEQKAKKVTKVRLKVGLFSGVVPELLESAFEIYKKGTMAQDAVLEIVKVPVKAQCRKCKCDFSPDDFTLICPKCYSWDIEVLSGEDLLLEKIELEI